MAGPNQKDVKAPALVPSPPPPAVTPRPEPPKISWTCDLKNFSEETKKPTQEPIPELTVGKKFSLHCEGDRVSLARHGLTLELPKEQAYALKILDVDSLTDNSVDLIVTGYRAGEIKLPDLILTDGKEKIGLKKVEFNIVSVLSGNPKPYPPYAPLSLAWPIWVWVALSIFGVLIGLGIWRLTQRNRLYRKLREQLDSRPIAVSPYIHFNKELRRLAREHELVGGGHESGEKVLEFIRALNEAFDLFIAGELLVPAFDFTPGEVRRALKRQDRSLHKQVGRDLYVVLRELYRALKAGSLSDHDGRQLLELCRKVADVIAKARGG